METTEIETPDFETDPYYDSGFRDALRNAINEHSIDTHNDTPDFVLADYLVECLHAYDSARLMTSNFHTGGPIKRDS